MTRVPVLVLLMTLTALGTEVSPASVRTDQTSGVTFNKDVLPILQSNCQVCHRPGGIAPMSLMTFQNTRPWAKAIKAKVVSRQMPPWFADPLHGEFRNAPKLTEANIQTLAAWADTGALEGDAGDKPAESPHWKEGWRIEPDVVISMPEPYQVAATGKGEIQKFRIPSPFEEDTWVTSIEIRPGDPSVVHHVILQFRDKPRENKVTQLPNGDTLVTIFADPPDPITNRGGGSYYGGAAETFTTMDAVYAPGSPPLDFRYTNSAKLIPGGKAIQLEVHYTPNGKATSDRTMVGFTVAKTPAERRFIIMAPESLADTRESIRAGASNWTTRGQLTFKQDVDLVWFMPHMHLRGKDMTFRLIYPNGHKETLLKAMFNFHWQLGYELARPVRVPRGSRLMVIAHHDNSANNRDNPDPKQAVVWGDMTNQEMMIPWFGVIVDHDFAPSDIATYVPLGLDLKPTPSNLTVE
jgi:hypothetical protein